MKKFVLFTLVVCFCIIPYAEADSASWWNSSFKYRIPIDVISNTNNLTDYQTKVEINLTDDYDNGYINETGRDIRFVNSTNHEISFWIEEMNISGGNSIVWVKVPNIANITNETIYMYFGNEDANSKSNGDSTFQHFVNFTRDGVISYGGSQDSDPSSYTIIDEDRTLRIYGNCWKATAISLTLNNDLQLDFDFKNNGSATEINGAGFDTQTSSLLPQAQFYKIDGSQSWGITPVTWTTYSGSGEYENINIVLDDFSGSFTYLVLPNDADSGSGFNIFYKNIRVRKYISSEPNTYISSIEYAVQYRDVSLKGVESNKEWLKIGGNLSISLDLWSDEDLDSVDALICNPNNLSFNISQADRVGLINTTARNRNSTWINTTYVTENNLAINGTYLVKFNVTLFSSSFISEDTYEFYVDNSTPEFTSTAYDEVISPYPLTIQNKTIHFNYNISDDVNISKVWISYDYYNSTKTPSPSWEPQINVTFSLNNTYGDNLWFYNCTIYIDWKSDQDKLNFTIYVNDTSGRLTILDDQFLGITDTDYPYVNNLTFDWNEIENPLGITSLGKYIPLANQTINIWLNASDPSANLDKAYLHILDPAKGTTFVYEMSPVSGIDTNREFKINLTASQIFAYPLMKPVFWVKIFDYSGNFNETKPTYNRSDFEYGDDNEYLDESGYYPKIFTTFTYSPSTGITVNQTDVTINNLLFKDNLEIKNVSLYLNYSGHEVLFWNKSYEGMQVKEISIPSILIGKSYLNESGTYKVVGYIFDNRSWMKRYVSDDSFIVSEEDLDSPVFEDITLTQTSISTDQSFTIYVNISDASGLDYVRVRILSPEDKTYLASSNMYASGGGIYYYTTSIDAEQFGLQDSDPLGFGLEWDVNGDHWSELIDRNWTVYFETEDVKGNPKSENSTKFYLDNLSDEDQAWNTYDHADWLLDQASLSYYDSSAVTSWRSLLEIIKLSNISSETPSYLHAKSIITSEILNQLTYDTDDPVFTTVEVLPQSANSSTLLTLRINITDINRIYQLTISIEDPLGGLFKENIDIASFANVSENYFEYKFDVNSTYFKSKSSYTSDVWEKDMLGKNWEISISATDTWTNDNTGSTNFILSNFSLHDKAEWYYLQADEAIGLQQGFDENLQEIRQLIDSGEYQSAIDKAKDVIAKATEKGGGGGTSWGQIIAIIVAILAVLGGLLGMMKARAKQEDVKTEADAALGSTIELVDERKEYGFAAEEYEEKINEGRAKFDEGKMAEAKKMMLELEKELINKSNMMKKAYKQITHLKDDIIERGITTPKAEKLFNEAKDLYKKEEFTKSIEVCKKAEEEANKGLEGRTVFG